MIVILQLIFILKNNYTKYLKESGLEFSYLQVEY